MKKTLAPAVALLGVIVGSIAGGCWCPSYSEYPPLVSALLTGSTDGTRSWGDEPIDGDLVVDVDVENERVVVSFESDARAIVHTYRIVSTRESVY